MAYGDSFSAVQAADLQERRDRYVADQNSLNRFVGVMGENRAQRNFDTQQKRLNDSMVSDNKYRADYFKYIQDQDAKVVKDELAAVDNAGPLIARQVHDRSKALALVQQKKQQAAQALDAGRNAVKQQIAAGLIKMDTKGNFVPGNEADPQSVRAAQMATAQLGELDTVFSRVSEEFDLLDNDVRNLMGEASSSGFMYDPQSRGLKHVQTGKFFRYQDPADLAGASSRGQAGRQTAFGFVQPPNRTQPVVGDLRVAEQQMRGEPSPTAPVVRRGGLAGFGDAVDRATASNPVINRMIEQPWDPEASEMAWMNVAAPRRPMMGDLRERERTMPQPASREQIARRMRELVGSGLTVDAAAAQARREFRLN